MTNVDPNEIEKFDQIASRWWNLNGEFKPLHDINPLRMEFIQREFTLNGATGVDIGCGGGILTESLAKVGAQMTGADLAEDALNVARAHADESELTIDYRQIPAEELALSEPNSFDFVTCMEMLEHVPDPSSVVQACADLVKPGGTVFFSTLNRTTKSYLMAIVGAEHIMKLLPKGTHDHAKFIKPSELTEMARWTGLDLHSSSGLIYNPLMDVYSLSPSDLDVNYMMAFTKPVEA